MEKRYAVGIDLGTSNSALAYCTATESGSPQVLPIPQLLSFQTTGDKDSLASSLYLPLEQEQKSASAHLPWENDSRPDGLIGEFARTHGALLPERLVTSAKSWLCNAQINPEEPLLPWKSDLGERKISPIAASQRYLEHLRKAFEQVLTPQGDKPSIAECEIVLTVPASFDEIARIHTHMAAEAAGWGEVTLLEEQQAAFYHWIDACSEGWREQVSPGDIVLICDVGGGTADFSLVAVTEQQGELNLERISVGDHILLGGDNMDLALAYTLKVELDNQGKKIDNWQFLSLVHSCRIGKEKLFADPDVEAFPIALPSRGSSLFARTITTELSREVLNRVLLDGFFPRCGIDEQPLRKRQVGLREFGLDYAAEPALSKHLAQFLARSRQNIHSNEELQDLLSERIGEDRGVSFLRPSAVLFNGGVFKADPLRQRMLDILAAWNGGETVRELAGSHFDLAVAKGAAGFARTRITGKGIRIKAGTARSYYIGLESSMPAVPGFAPPIKAMCVVPQGMEEGTDAALADQEFGLITGEPVDFRFFSSNIRAGDRVGDIVKDENEIEETAQLEVTLPPAEDKAGELIPVTLHSVITELGTLELWMRHEPSAKQWKVEFNVRTQ
jgi:Hsp70 protein